MAKKKVTIEIEADTSKAKITIGEMLKALKEDAVININTNFKSILAKLNQLKIPTSSKHTVEVNIKEALEKIEKVKENLQLLSLTFKPRIDTKSAQENLTKLQRELQKLNHIVKLSVDMKDVENRIKEMQKPSSSMFTIISNVKDIFAKLNILRRPTTSLHTVIAKTRNVLEKIKILRLPTQSLHTVIPDTLNAQTEIDQLKQTTFSTHIVNVIKRRAMKLGGPIRAIKAQAGRFFPGYGGGDKIPILGEAGEFMLRKESVRKIGLPAVEALNRGDISGLLKRLDVVQSKQELAEGGEVKSLGSLDVNLLVGGKSFPMKTDKKTAVAFRDEIKNMNIIYGKRKHPY